MAHRTFTIGDIHGDLKHLDALLSILPSLDGEDTLVFLGDYLDRGPDSAGVIQRLRDLPGQTPARIITLRGNHEDGWLHVLDGGFLQFILPISNGCLAACRSFTGGPVPAPDELGSREELLSMSKGDFLPEEVKSWLYSLPVYYEDEHAIYVHAGLPKKGGRFLHPSELTDPRPILWERSDEFFRSYVGKRVVFGHTMVEILPQELSIHTPDDAMDVYIGANIIGVDTCCGHGGFLSAVELPGLHVYESRSVLGNA